MPHYRAYILDEDDHFLSAMDYQCRSDDDAMAVMMLVYTREDIELWSGTRRVKRLKAGVPVSLDSD